MIDYRTINADFIPGEQDKEPEKWLELRTTGIGGSDAGTIMGLNKYSSPLVVYSQKKKIQGFKGNKATEWGHILEEPVRQKSREELGYEIITVPGMYRSREHDFMNANIDGLMYIPAERPLSLNGNEASGLVGHEIKTSSRGEGFAGDDIPDSYYCQVQHYMAVTSLEYFVLTVFFLSTKTGRHYLIPRNDTFIQSLIDNETDFWENYVLKNVVPEPTGIDAEAEYLKNVPLASDIVLDDETEELIAQERNLDEKIKELSREQAAMKNKIICKLISDGGESPEKVSAAAGRFRISYNTQVRKSVDTAALKKAGLFDEYAKESSSRVLRISEVKAGA